MSSVGLRRHTVDGIGRDQGVTSAPTTAMLAAARRSSVPDSLGGACQLQLARELARAFIAVSDAAPAGASVHNLPGRRTAVSEVVDLIGAPGIGFEDVPLPLPRSRIRARSRRAARPGLRRDTARRRDRADDGPLPRAARLRARERACRVSGASLWADTFKRGILIGCGRPRRARGAVWRWAPSPSRGR